MIRFAMLKQAAGSRQQAAGSRQQAARGNCVLFVGIIEYFIDGNRRK